MTATGFVDSQGARLYFERVGNGPPLLFIHAGVADLRMWDAQVDFFAGSFDCIRFDLRGFGQTQNEADKFSPGDDVSAVLDHLAVERSHIVGLSMGGSIAADFAIEHPERVSSIALVAAGVSGLEHQPEERESAAFEEMDRAYEEEKWDELVELELQMWLDGPGRAGRIKGQLRDRMRAMCRGSYERGEPEATRVPIDPPASGRLLEIQAPTLIISGTYDTTALQAFADHMANGIPGASRIEYEGVAHMINLEKPERFNADLLAFLKKAE